MINFRVRLVIFCYNLHVVYNFRRNAMRMEEARNGEQKSYPRNRHT